MRDPNGVKRAFTRFWGQTLAGLLLAVVLAVVLAAAGGTQAYAQTASDGGQGTAVAPAKPEAPAKSAVTDGLPKAGGFGLTKSQTANGTTKTSTKSISVLPATANAPDYAAWERLATRAEAAIADRATSDAGLNLLRGQLVDWRSAMSVAQSTNATRISTLRTQIAALGPVPADGAVEVIEIADRRKALTDQLVRLQAPGIAAEEAYTRADGLIREIDSTLRERQADALLKLWPTPANPANWAVAAAGIRDTSVNLWAEFSNAWGKTAQRNLFYENIPVMLGLFLVALLLIWRGRAVVERMALRLQEKSGTGGRKFWALLTSLGQIAVPVFGVFLLATAAELSQMVGPMGKAVLRALPVAGIVAYTAYWLGGRVFPVLGDCQNMLQLPESRRREGRMLSLFLGVMVGFEDLRGAYFGAAPAALPEAAVPVLSLPGILLTSFLLWRLSRLLRRHVSDGQCDDQPMPYRDRVIGFLARGAGGIAVVGPILAVIGYISAASALVYPAALSLGLIAVLLIVMQLVSDIFDTISGPQAARTQLIPVLFGFFMTLSALPLFALIWGARADDLRELWTRFSEGFQLGQTRISPSDFLYFLVLFAVGFFLTRLLQGALKSSVLPKTSLDQGGQNSVVSGVGYMGIFLSALVAINAAGIDLSGLAIVAGALSVGIGFGLQNIVSNFVSGIILLIERPVSEGDWIEVGTVSGWVKSISVRSTRITTFDRSDVIVPNADLVSQQVTNWTHYNLTGRLVMSVGVDYGSDTRKVAQILQEIAEEQPLALLDPKPSVFFMGIGTDALNFELRVVLRDVNFMNAVRTEINHRIFERFQQEGIQMPFSQRDIWLRNPEAIAQALAALQKVSVPSAAPTAAEDLAPNDPALDVGQAPMPNTPAGDSL